MVDMHHCHVVVRHEPYGGQIRIINIGPHHVEPVDTPDIDTLSFVFDQPPQQLYVLTPSQIEDFSQIHLFPTLEQATHFQNMNWYPDQLLRQIVVE